MQFLCLHLHDAEVFRRTSVRSEQTTCRSQGCAETGLDLPSLGRSSITLLILFSFAPARANLRANECTRYHRIYTFNFHGFCTALREVTIAGARLPTTTANANRHCECITTAMRMQVIQFVDLFCRISLLSLRRVFG